MKRACSLTEKTKQFLAIFSPIFVSQISLMATGFFDTVMSGQASHYDLAGVAIGANLWLPVYTGLGGILAGITPIVAQLNGASRKGDMAFLVVQGAYLALFLALVVIIGGWFLLTPILNIMQLEAAVHDIARGFLAALSIGVVPLFVSVVLRNFLDALGYTRITMLVTLCVLPVNIVLNYMLILGNLGCPRLGGVGAGYASAITYWCLAAVSLGVICFKEPFKSYHIFRKFFRVSLAAWRELLAVGLPIGLSIFCEVSIFGIVAMLMSEYGTATIAAHQAAINFAGLIYMVPLSIGMTLTIIIGFEVGAGRYDDARKYSYLGIGIAVAFAVGVTVGLLIFNNKIAGLYTGEPEVFEQIKSFLVYAIFFQFSDAIAAPVQGTLRGYKDVKVTFLMAIVSYWVIGMPTGYLLAKYTYLQPYGYWVGFIVGLAVGATALAVRLARLQQKYKM
ncbi:MAG TPA: MATE family efflux transporter [Methylomusa anaerophila]|uniref:Probable multidrug resistance protein NorM n=1 Tax=Methylomusa anaerophila TaxID=1930071 RepID=A0A348ALZ8_9FIRM|nr:MATE family efflux transporter [Methylomusa anaerophila]BBB92096.1 multidrug resistance protein NorM [Methylomusa anaerophila]HML87890.1 MATE family efflux transporter [Methylomusa anaerophila]